MAPLRLLFIDDDEADLETFRQWFGDHEVHTIRNLADIDQEDSYDIVFCDVNMPLEAFRPIDVIKLCRTFSGTRIIGFSGGNEGEISKEKATIQAAINARKTLSTEQIKRLANDLRRFAMGGSPTCP
jgi:CheY-like chemotaxis protein